MQSTQYWDRNGFMWPGLPTDSPLDLQIHCLGRGGFLTSLGLRLVLWSAPLALIINTQGVLNIKIPMRYCEEKSLLRRWLPCLGKQDKSTYHASWPSCHSKWVVELGIALWVPGKSSSPQLSWVGRRTLRVSSCFPAFSRCLCLLFQCEKLSEWSGPPHVLPDPCQSSVWDYPLP